MMLRPNVAARRLPSGGSSGTISLKFSVSFKSDWRFLKGDGQRAGKIQGVGSPASWERDARDLEAQTQSTEASSVTPEK